MTAKQIISHLEKAGFAMSKVLEVSRDEVEVTGHHIKCGKILGFVCATRTGYGSYVMRPALRGADANTARLMAMNID